MWRVEVKHSGFDEILHFESHSGAFNFICHRFAQGADSATLKFVGNQEKMNQPITPHTGNLRPIGYYLSSSNDLASSLENQYGSFCQSLPTERAIGLLISILCEIQNQDTQNKDLIPFLSELIHGRI